MKLITLKTNDVFEISAILIKNAEGFSSHPYIDTLGHSTIGYGFNMSLPSFSGLKNISTHSADILLEKEISYILSSSFFGNLPYLPSHIMATLVDMAYNMGIEGLIEFDTFLGFLYKSQIDEAISDLTETLWYKQVGQRAVRNCFNIMTKSNLLFLI